MQNGMAICIEGCVPSITGIARHFLLTLTLALTLPYGLGNAGTRAVSMILEYSMDTLPARSILVALPGSA